MLNSSSCVASRTVVLSAASSSRQFSTLLGRSSVSCKASPSSVFTNSSTTSSLFPSSTFLAPSASTSTRTMIWPGRHKGPPSLPGGYAKEEKQQWHEIDATNQIVGRLAVRIAERLMGKNKITFTPNVDDGDHVVVINCDKIKFTGKKWDQKLYRYHSGYPGGLKEIPARKWQTEHPERILQHAVAGMIPKNKLKVPRLRRLFVYKGGEHPHVGQLNRQARDAINQAQTSTASATATATKEDVLPEDPAIKEAILKDRKESAGKPAIQL